MALTKIDDRGLKTPIDLLDNEKIRFGTGDDLELYHTGSASYISNSTGFLFIHGNDIALRSAAGENYIVCDANAEVELYYDAVKKFETTSTGATVSGDDLLLSGGGHSKLKLLTTGTGHATGIQITHASGDGAQQIWQFQTDGSADGDLKLRNATSGTDIFYVQPDNNIRFEDSRKLLLGTGSDLQIYHDGSHSYIEDTGTGNLYIDANQFYLRNNDSSNVLLQTTSAGVVQLKHNGTTKFETTSAGVTITGNAVASSKFRGNDNVKLSLGDGEDLQIYHDGSHSRIVDAGTNYIKIQSGQVAIINEDDSEAMIQAYANGAVEIFYDNSKKFETTTNGPAVSSQGADDSKLYFLTGNHTTTRIGYVGLNQFGMDVNGGVQIRDAGNSYETMFKTVSNGAVELYHNGVKKCETHADGLHIGDGGNLDMPSDSSKIVLGAGDDLQIYHDGTHSYIKNTHATAYTLIDATSNIKLRTNDTETGLEVVKNGGVDLYHNNSKVFETLGNGVRAQGGIMFGSDTADANRITDYEEGTYTPVLNASVNSYSRQVGYYTKIGNVVHASIWITVSSAGTNNANSLQVTLPFTSKNATDYRGGGTFTAESVTFDTAYSGINRTHIDLNTSNMEMSFGFKSDHNAGWNTSVIKQNNIDNESAFQISVTYLT